MTASAAVAIGLGLSLAVTGCGSPSDLDEPDPGPGPHFTVSPVEIGKIARITPLGTNGKILPLGHTYWYTCDTEYILPVEEPCFRERLAIRAPASGEVVAVEHVADGGITVEGPPGLYAGFAHVTPVEGLSRGSRVTAGDTIAWMYTDFAFDFGVTNYGIDEHQFANQERYRDLQAYRYTQSPVAQFGEPLRSQLVSRVVTESDPLGRITYDQTGTASGGWFLEGTPISATFTPAYTSAILFLGPLQERPDMRILSNEAGWFTAIMDIGIVDPGAPRWEAITPASGRVWIPLWEVDHDGGPRPDAPKGGVLVEVLPGERLHVQYFSTHDVVTDFAGTPLTYVR